MLEISARAATAALLGAVLASGAHAQSLTLSGAQAVLKEQAAASLPRARLAAQDAAEARADGWGVLADAPRLKGVRVAPDASYTPGHLCTPDDPNFKEYRYAEHIPYCNRVVTRAMKLEIAAHYGVAEADWHDYEFDHLIPLAAGGDSSIDNLWPQPHGDPDGSDGKDRLENQLYLQMKAGTITQAEAVRRIYAWFNAELIIQKALSYPAI